MKTKVAIEFLKIQLGNVRFEIVSEAADYLVCRRYLKDGTLSDTESNVAKPYLLRNSITSRNGLTFTYAGFSARTANNGSDTEDQVVVPEYVVGDQIYAFKPLNGTGVDSAPKWQEGDSARAWAKVFE